MLRRISLIYQTMRFFAVAQNDIKFAATIHKSTAIKRKAPQGRSLEARGLVWRNYSQLGNCNLNITYELCAPTCRCLNSEADVTVLRE